MPRADFHDQPFDSGTLAKLEIFEFYAQGWIPVFLSRSDPPFGELHIFDFFCGPGRDSNRVKGSPLRILDQLRRYHRAKLRGWDKVRKAVHLFDADNKKIEILRRIVAEEGWKIEDVQLDIRSLEFSAALREFGEVLNRATAAKLLIIDQFGVDQVSDTIFTQLISYPRTDFIFFLSSSTLHRFRNHPAIKQKIPHPDDFYHVHRATYQYYRSLIPPNLEAFLGQFSIKKQRSNIYGLIFGSQHPLGIHKFLQVAWRNDKISGEANFDVDREGIREGELLLDLAEMKPKKIQAFETALTNAFRARKFKTEADVVRYCIEAGMTCQHTKPVISNLKREGLFKSSFQVPDVRRIQKPRLISYC